MIHLRPAERTALSNLSNGLLDLLPTQFDNFRGKLIPVSLPLRTPIYQPHEPPTFAHFLTSGIASVVTQMKSGFAALFCPLADRFFCSRGCGSTILRVAIAICRGGNNSHPASPPQPMPDGRAIRPVKFPTSVMSK